MSLRKRSVKKFNRAEVAEETWWIVDEYLFEDYDRWGERYYWDDVYVWIWDHIMAYHGDGGCRNMKEYHGMHLLTLLRSLQLRTAEHATSERGW